MPLLEDTIESQDENLVFQMWKEAPEEDKPKYLTRLTDLLQRHATAVCVIKTGRASPDVVNAAVWRALSRNETFKGESKFSTWFHSIAINECNRDMGIARRRAEVPITDHQVTANQEEVERRIELQELQRGLSSRQRLLVSFKLEGLSDQDIALRMNRTIPAIKNMWYKAKAKMERNAKK